MSRELGEKIAISVGTAIPFEEKVMVDGDKPDSLWMNVKTLFRNFWGAYSNESRPTVNNMFQDFVDELNTIDGLCMSQGIKPRFYIPDYNGIGKMMPKALTKEKLTEGQLSYRSAETAMMKAALGGFRTFLGTAPTKDDPMIECRVKIPGSNDKAWIITSFPTDLLSRYEWADLQLLESHTGELKGPMEWHTKVSKNPDHDRIPFNVLAIQVFGDKSNLLRAYSIKYKRELVKLAQARNWTQFTVMTKVKHDLDFIEDAEMRELFLEMCQATLV